jgi:hypothetical protein
VRFGVLGPLLVADSDGRWLTLRGDRLRCLLAMLLFHANEFVPAERLVSALWPGVPPKSYSSNLHTYVSRLRERIGPALIDHAGHAYRLRVAEDELDMLIFLGESDLGRRAARTGDPTAAAAHFRRALTQWRDQDLVVLAVPGRLPQRLGAVERGFHPATGTPAFFAATSTRMPTVSAMIITPLTVAASAATTAATGAAMRVAGRADAGLAGASGYEDTCVCLPL